jgi:hypothetical protein
MYNMWKKNVSGSGHGQIWGTVPAYSYAWEMGKNHSIPKVGIALTWAQMWTWDIQYT